MATKKAIVKAFETDERGRTKVLFEGAKGPIKVEGEKLTPLLEVGKEVEFEVCENSFPDKKNPGKTIKYSFVKFPGEEIKRGGGGGKRPYDPTPTYKVAALDAAVKLCIHNAGNGKIDPKCIQHNYDELLKLLKA